ncbi:MAG: phosphoribosyltransferase [Candidatus Thermoplasmatota archaeon]
MTGYKCKIVSWDEVAKWSEELARKIMEKNFKVDVVVGLTRGGWVPARIMCDHLQTKSLYAIKTEHWGITATKTGNARIAQKLGVNIENKNVLVMDDITDTGESLSLAMEHVQSLKPKKAHSATLLHITHSKIVPDFYTVEVPKEDWTWFIFPWNFNEDMRTIVQQILVKEKSLNEMMDELEESYSLRLNSFVIEKTLRDLKSTGAVMENGDRWIKC